MPSIFEVNPLKEGPFPTKRRVIWASTPAGGAAPRSHGKHCSGTSGNGGSGGGPGGPLWKIAGVFKWEKSIQDVCMYYKKHMFCDIIYIYIF